MKSYTIAADGKSIICKRCGRTSYNQGDVEHKFCVVCGHHSEDPTPGHKVEKIWALVATSPDGSEGICGLRLGPTDMLQACVSDPLLVAHLRATGQRQAKQDPKTKITLRCFEHGTDLEEL